MSDMRKTVRRVGLAAATLLICGSLSALASQPAAATDLAAPATAATALPASAATATASTAATTQPNSGNTGVPPGVRLTVHSGDLSLRTAGAHYDALDVHGFVYVEASNVTITRSIIRGGVAHGNMGLVMNTTASNFVLQDSELVPEHPSVWIDGVKGSNYTLRRVDIHGTVDSAKVYGNNVRIESSWLHDNQQYSADPNQRGGPTHNDGVQVLGGHNIRIFGNAITGASNAALMVTQDYSSTSDLQFSGNWVDNGACSINLAHKPLKGMGGITLGANRFGRRTRISGCAILATHATSVATYGNVWDDNNVPVGIRRWG